MSSSNEVKPTVNKPPDEVIGEPSQPEEEDVDAAAPQQQQKPNHPPGHQYTIPSRPFALAPSRPNKANNKNGGGGLMTASTGRNNMSLLPQQQASVRPSEDGRNNGNASEGGITTSSTPVVPIQNSNAADDHPKKETTSQSPKTPLLPDNTIHRTTSSSQHPSSQPDASLARADSTDSAKRPPPRPLDVTRSVRNKAPTSPMPLYAQQLLSGPLLSPFPVDDVVMDNSNSDEEGEESEYIYTCDIMQTLSSLKRKRRSGEDDEAYLHSSLRRQRPSIADPEVVAATRDVLVMLQIYGPLTHVQLKVNIETQFQEEESGSSSTTTAAATAATISSNKLQKVLDILVELGVIHILNENTASEINNVSSTAAAAGSKTFRTNSDNNNNNNPIYCFGNGARRMDSILPPDTLREIHEAGNELTQTQQRIRMLQSFLTVDDTPPPSSSTKKNTSEKGSSGSDAKLSSGHTTTTATPPTHEDAKSALHQIMVQHPEIVHDPTYAAALRLFKIHDVTKQTPDTTDGSCSVVSTKKGSSSSSKKRQKSIDSAVDSMIMIDESQRTMGSSSNSSDGNESPMMIDGKTNKS